MKYLSRLTALLLAFVLLFSSSVGVIAESDISDLTRSGYDQMVSAAKEAAEAEAAAAAQEAAKQPIINEGGVVYAQDIPEQTKRFDIYEVITDAQLSMGGETEITLPQSGKINLSAGTAAQWQIYIPGADMWVNIAGETGDTFALTYAVIGGMLSGGSAKVRALAGDSAAVANISVAYGSALPPVEEEDTFVAEAAAASTFALRRSASTSDANAGIMLADAGDAEKTKRTVTINYMLNGTAAATTYVAEIGVKQSYSATVLNPIVVGYEPTMPDAVNVENAEVEFTKDAVVYSVTPGTADVEINIVYQPALVNFTVIRKFQNVDNDEYTELTPETYQALTGTSIKDYETDNGTLATKYDGFYSLLYNVEETVGADGETVVEIYYDRYYYLMNFQLGENGYGTEPVYARYGSVLSEIEDPKRAGYTFVGWSLDGTNVIEDDDMPTTMPAQSRTYIAIWEADTTAKVTIVFWGENANDEGYSYIRSTAIECEPNTEYTYSSANTVCPMIEHTHDNCKIVCGHICQPNTCYTAESGQLSEFTGTLPSGITDQNPTEDGIYSYSTSGIFGRTYYYLKLNGKWYTGSNARVEIVESCTHHYDTCYDCGMIAHTHSDECENLWRFKESDTVTVKVDGSTIVNVYYDRTEFTLTFKYGNNYNTVATITDKWGADIQARYNAIAANSGTMWSEDTDDGPYTNNFPTMHEASKTFYLHTTSGNVLNSMTYYLQNLEGTGYTQEFKTTWYGDSSGWGSNGYYNVTEEDFYKFEGFTIDEEKSAKIGDDCNDVKFYYSRNSYSLIFNDGYSDVKTESVKYEAPLTTYTSFVPTAPSAYEPGSVYFGGWYLNPECTGAEYKLAEHTMPADNVLLYAKWVPVEHTVKFYLNEAAYNTDTQLASHPAQTVNHGAFLSGVEEPDNGDYTFIGWFYVDDEGVEKAFDFVNMPIKQDMKVYAKWRSDVLREYSVYFKIQDTDKQIADPIIGSTLAGEMKTFYAKGGDELYPDYQEGFFPLTQSHSITLDMEDESKNTFTFWYVEAGEIPYSVYYVTEQQPSDANKIKGTIERDGKTYYMLADTKNEPENKKAVVTEQFEPVSGYVPDAFQKRLVVDGTEGAVNEIIFYYTEDTKHAYYQITHYTQGVDGTWNEYTSTQAMGDIGTTYSEEPLVINGFTYDPNAEEDALDSGVLTENGLDLKLYYTRNQYPYKVRYLLYGTEDTENEVHLKPEKTVDADGNLLEDVHGKTVAEVAATIDDYEVVGDTAKTLTIRIEDEIEYNVFTFLYQEKLVEIKYEVVGPDGCGFVTPSTETIKVLSGEAQGSTATANKNYKFVGWYDAEDNLLTEELSFVPAKVNGKNVAATYYAKFVLDKAPLTITKTGMSAGENAIFNVSGPGFNGQVDVPNEGSITLFVTCGDYTVTEAGDWTSRYEVESTSGFNQDGKVTVAAGGATVTFANKQNKFKWLDDESSKNNQFK